MQLNKAAAYTVFSCRFLVPFSTHFKASLALARRADRTEVRLLGWPPTGPGRRLFSCVANGLMHAPTCAYSGMVNETPISARQLVSGAVLGRSKNWSIIAVPQGTSNAPWPTPGKVYT